MSSGADEKCYEEKNSLWTVGNAVYKEMSAPASVILPGPVLPGAVLPGPVLPGRCFAWACFAWACFAWLEMFSIKTIQQYLSVKITGSKSSDENAI